MKRAADIAMIEQLQKQILDLQGYKAKDGEQLKPLGLGLLESAFPGKVFMKEGVHEFISTSPEGAACTSGFISVVLGKLMQQNGFCLWISTIPRRSIFPPALKMFGIDPGRILFVDTARPKETLWAVEEALKCNALAAVVGELSELTFNDSRRLQLAVEKSKVTGLIHRYRPKTENAVACVTRWKITPLPAVPTALPGVGFPCWQVDLLKVRNGRPASWQVQWAHEQLEYSDSQQLNTARILHLKTG